MGEGEGEEAAEGVCTRMNREVGDGEAARPRMRKDESFRDILDVKIGYK